MIQLTFYTEKMIMSEGLSISVERLEEEPGIIIVTMEMPPDNLNVMFAHDFEEEKTWSEERSRKQGGFNCCVDYR